MKLTKVVATVSMSLALMALSSSAFALLACALDVETAQGTWRNEVYASRGDEFGNGTVRKLDDGDKCRRNGRRIGPDICRDAGSTQYRIRAKKNSGKEVTWYEQCS